MRKYNEITCPGCGSNSVVEETHEWEDDETIIVYFSCRCCNCLFKVKGHVSYDDASEVLETSRDEYLRGFE